MMRIVRSVTLVVPVFNESEGLQTLFAALEDFIASHPEHTTEVIFVDDHSSDDSLKMLRDAAKRNAYFRALSLSRRCGSHVAIIAGLSRASGDVAVFLAADLQDPLELIPAMIAEYAQGSEIVWGVREGVGEISRIDALTSRIFYDLMMQLSKIGAPPYQASFALLSRRCYLALVSDAPPRASLIIEIPRLGFLTASIPFRKLKRRHGRSKWTLGRKTMALADAVVASSYAPLRAMAYVGMLVSLLGFMFAAVIMVRWFTGFAQPSGWPSLMVAVLILSGLQMLMLGVIGEYLWRTNEMAGRRKLFHIQEEHGFGAGGGADGA